MTPQPDEEVLEIEGGETGGDHWLSLRESLEELSPEALTEAIEDWITAVTVRGRETWSRELSAEEASVGLTGLALALALESLPTALEYDELAGVLNSALATWLRGGQSSCRLCLAVVAATGDACTGRVNPGDVEGGVHTTCRKHAASQGLLRVAGNIF